MEIRNLGRSGLRVSAIGLGCNNFGGRTDLEASRAVIHKALDLGVTLFDTADIYAGSGGSETVLGKVLGPARKRIVLASKFGMAMDASGERQGGSRQWIMAEVEESLRRLNTDWIDLYQLHCPDPRTPIEETLRALDDLVRQGKVRYCGCSNLPGWQVVEAAWTAREMGLTQFVSCQDEYSLLERGIEAELLPAARAYGLGLLPFYPLAGGFLSGKYRPGAAPAADTRLGKVPNLAKRFLTEANWARIDALTAFAAARGKTLLELAFAWLLARTPVASVIAGATKPEQLEQNVKAGDWKLSAEECAEIDHLVSA